MYDNQSRSNSEYEQKKEFERFETSFKINFDEKTSHKSLRIPLSQTSELIKSMCLVMVGLYFTMRNVILK
jgi:hypothetical protein